MNLKTVAVIFWFAGWTRAQLPATEKLEAAILEMDACDPNAEKMTMVQKDVDIVKKGDSYWCSGHFEVNKKVYPPILVRKLLSRRSIGIMTRQIAADCIYAQHCITWANPRVNVKAYKCKTPKDRDSCEMYVTYEGDGCEQLKSQEGPLYSVMSKVGSNNTQCPLTMESLSFKDMEVHIKDSDAMMANSISHTWWAMIEVTGALSEGGAPEKMMCMDVWLNVKPEGPERTRKFG